MKIFIVLFMTWMSLAKADIESTQWIYSQSKAYRGQALIIHGLNTKPEKMMGIIEELNLRGFDAFLLKLHGHEGDVETMRKVTCDDWENQVLMGFKEVSALNAAKGGKILLAGFSIGALLPLELMMRKPDLKVDLGIFFAPALSLNKTSYLVNFFKIFGDRFVVPSFSPAEYRAQEGTSMGAYRCLFKAVDGFEKNDLKKLNFPTLIFMSPDDKLVSYEGIKKIEKKMVNSKLVSLDNSKSLISSPNDHLIIDKKSLGPEEWNNKVLTGIDNFLNPY